MITTLEQFYEMDWFKKRPPHVQAAFKAKPLDIPYYLKVRDSKNYYGVRVIGVDEQGEGEPCTYRIYVDGIMPPVTARQVFGITADDLLAEIPKDGELLYMTQPTLPLHK